jgi:hypothetical protein
VQIAPISRQIPGQRGILRFGASETGFAARNRCAERSYAKRKYLEYKEFLARKEKTPKGCEAWSFQSTQTVYRAWKASSIKKSGRSFFAFKIGKDATHHRRPYTSRTPGCSTSNAGRSVLISSRYDGADPLLEHRRGRRCRHASHRHRGRGRRGAPRRRSGFQLLTRVTGPSPRQFQVSTLRFSIYAASGWGRRYGVAAALNGASIVAPVNGMPHVLLHSSNARQKLCNRSATT